MTDKELLELAAKAAGYDFKFSIKGCPLVDGCHWNPLTDDGDALRLAVKLNLLVSIYSSFAIAGGDDTRHGWKFMVDEEKSIDPYAATRRAIVRAAAEIGRAK